MTGAAGTAGTGPRYMWTRFAGGKTEGRQVASGAEVDKVRAEVANYKEFLFRVDQIVEVNVS